MKSLAISVLALSLLSSFVFAQETKEATGKVSTTTQSLNKSLGVNVFPAKDQKPDQQAKDEQACYEWAVQQSGIDPLNLKTAEPDSVAKDPDGSAAKGPAKRAAVSAATGGLAGAAARKRRQTKQEAESKKVPEAKNQQAIDSFKKAYSACLEGKGYSVK